MITGRVEERKEYRFNAGHMKDRVNPTKGGTLSLTTTGYATLVMRYGPLNLGANL